MEIRHSMFVIFNLILFRRCLVIRSVEWGLEESRGSIAVCSEAPVPMSRRIGCDCIVVQCHTDAWVGGQFKITIHWYPRFVYKFRFLFFVIAVPL